MAQNKNQLIVAELDLMASELESKGNLDLAGLIDEVSAELLTEEPVVVTKVEAKKAAPKPAKSNGKRRKKNKKKMSAPKMAVSRQDAKRVLKAAHAELLDIASELIKEGDLKEARKVIRYAEEVKQEEEARDSAEVVEDVLPVEDGMPESDDEDAEDAEDEDAESEDADEDADSEDAEGEDEPAAESMDSEDESEFEDEDDVADEDVEAMLRKYDLMDDMPEAPAVPSSTSCTMTPEVKPEEADEAEEEGDEEEEEEEEADEAEDGADVAQAEKLYSLAKKLALAGETRAAFAITELVDRIDSKKVKKAGVYTIQLTPEEYSTLSFFKNRGYDCGLLDALVVKDEAKGIYEIPEHEMWAVNEACEEHGAWTNLNWDSSLGKKIRKLLDSVV